MRIRALLLADVVILQPDGKTAILGAGIDRIMASRFPWAQAQLSVFVSLEGEGDEDGPGTEHDLRIRIRDPNSEVIAELGGPFTVETRYEDSPAMPGLQNAGMVFQQIQFPTEGVYSVEALIDQRDPETVRFNVVLGPPQQTQWAHVPAAGPPVA